MSTYIACHASRIVAYCMETPKVFAFPHLVHPFHGCFFPPRILGLLLFGIRFAAFAAVGLGCMYRAFISFCHRGRLERGGGAYKHGSLLVVFEAIY